MKRLSVILAAALLVPAAAQAQRPSNNVHTRSAETYFKDAAETSTTATEKQELYRKALNAALLGMKAEPGNPKTWFLAGRAYLRLGDLAGADSTFAKAEQIYPEYAKEIDPERMNAWVASYNEGVRAVQSGNIAGAITALENADRIYRKRPEALVTLGSIFMQQGDHAKAEQTFLKALALLRGDRSALKPQEVQSWNEDELTVAMRLATLYAEQTKYDQAEKVYRELLARQPENSMAQANLGVVLSRAGKTAEAAAVYKQLLARQDLGESALFNVGVGMFRAEQFADAAVAFRRAATINPHAHATLYNLAQALFGLTAGLEKTKQGATPARVQEINAQLAELNEEMRVVSERLRHIDPANRNVYMMLAQAQRSLAESATGAAADDWRKKALATLEQHKALPFEVTDITVIPSQTDYQIMGRVTNLTLAPGAPIKIRFIVVNREGAEIATHEFNVNAPAPDESTRISTTLKVPEGAVGWKYVIVK